MLANHSQVFAFVITALDTALTEAGVPHVVVRDVNVTDTANTYLLCTLHESGRIMPPNYVAYNFEQFIVYDDIVPLLRRRLANALMIWDYSTLNIDFLESHGLPAVHVPFGYSPTMDVQWNQKLYESKDMDLFFVGSMNARRALAFQDLKDKSLKSFFGQTWGPDHPVLMRRAKVGFNVHYYGGNCILEIHRIIPLIMHRVLVVSEPSKDTALDDTFRNIIDFVPASRLKEAGLKALRRPDRREEAERRYQSFKENFDYGRMVRQALASPMPAARS